MNEDILAKVFEHNNWANLCLIQVCSALNDEQLDAEPQSVTKGSIRRTLWHLVASQQRYLSLLTGTEPRFNWQTPPAFVELQEAANITGEGLRALIGSELHQSLKPRLQTRDGYWVEPWVVMVQVINHAAEHREQINSMLSALGVTPPDLDGWSYGAAAKALVPVSA